MYLTLELSQYKIYSLMSSFNSSNSQNIIIQQYSLWSKSLYHNLFFSYQAHAYDCW